MARIKNVVDFNANRKIIAKIKTTDENMVLIEKDELKLLILDFLNNELDLIVDTVTKEHINAINLNLNKKLDEFAVKVNQHYSDKLDKITEKIVGKYLSRLNEEEIEKRLNERINLIKQKL